MRAPYRRRSCPTASSAPFCAFLLLFTVQSVVVGQAVVSGETNMLAGAGRAAEQNARSLYLDDDNAAGWVFNILLLLPIPFLYVYSERASRRQLDGLERMENEGRLKQAGAEHLLDLRSKYGYLSDQERREYEVVRRREEGWGLWTPTREERLRQWIDSYYRSRRQIRLRETARRSPFAADQAVRRQGLRLEAAERALPGQDGQSLQRPGRDDGTRGGAPHDRTLQSVESEELPLIYYYRRTWTHAAGSRSAASRGGAAESGRHGVVPPVAGGGTLARLQAHPPANAVVRPPANAIVVDVEEYQVGMRAAVALSATCPPSRTEDAARRDRTCTTGGGIRPAVPCGPEGEDGRATAGPAADGDAKEEEGGRLS